LAAPAQNARLDVFRLPVHRGKSGSSAGEIAAAIGVGPVTLGFHLKEFTQAGLVRHRHEGCFIHYSANFEAIDRLLACLAERCCSDFDRCEPRIAESRGQSEAVRVRPLRRAAACRVASRRFLDHANDDR